MVSMTWYKSLIKLNYTRHGLGEDRVTMSTIQDRVTFQKQVSIKSRNRCKCGIGLSGDLEGVTQTPNRKQGLQG